MNKLLTVFVATFLCTGIASAQDTLYSETVANGSLENAWYPGFNGDSMEAEFMPGNPSGDGWVGSLKNTLSGGGVGQTFSGNPNFSDFYYEAQVYIPVDIFGYYGIEFRVDSAGLTSGYQFIAQFKPGEFIPPKLRFRKRPTNNPATPVVIKDWDSSEITIPTTTDWHKMAVQAQGNQFWLYFDGQELPGCPYTDTEFSSGWIGFYLFDLTFTGVSLTLNTDDIIVTGSATAINEFEPPMVSDFELGQNYPNPFNPSTTISFYIPTRELVQLGIHNNLGQRVRALVNGELSAGSHQVEWNAVDDAGNEVPAGVYYYRIQAGSFRAANKMLLIK